MNASPVGKPGAYPASSAVTQESGPRVAFDTKNKTFGPMKTSVTRNIDAMKRTSNQVKGLRVPTDYTSPAFLARVDTQFDSEAEQMQANTKGVNVLYTQNLLQSVHLALRAL